MITLVKGLRVLAKVALADSVSKDWLERSNPFWSRLSSANTRNLALICDTSLERRVRPEASRKKPFPFSSRYSLRRLDKSAEMCDFNRSSFSGESARPL